MPVTTAASTATNQHVHCFHPDPTTMTERCCLCGTRVDNPTIPPDTARWAWSPASINDRLPPVEQDEDERPDDDDEPQPVVDDRHLCEQCGRGRTYGRYCHDCARVMARQANQEAGVDAEGPPLCVSCGRRPVRASHQSILCSRCASVRERTTPCHLRDDPTPHCAHPIPGDVLEWRGLRSGHYCCQCRRRVAAPLPPVPRPDPVPGCADCGDPAVGVHNDGRSLCDECVVDMDLTAVTFRWWSEEVLAEESAQQTARETRGPDRRHQPVQRQQWGIDSADREESAVTAAIVEGLSTSLRERVDLETIIGATDV